MQLPHLGSKGFFSTPHILLKCLMCYSLIISFWFKLIFVSWRGGRAVECGGLENRCGGDSTGGSNPPLSVLCYSFM